MLGVFVGVLATLLAVGFTQEQMVQCGAVIAFGGGLGLAIGRRVSPMQLPQTVAALHSVVGLAAVMTSAASVLGAYEGHGKAEGGEGAGMGAEVVEEGKGHGLGGLHLTTAYLGVLIGGITFTGEYSLKIQGRDRSPMAFRTLLLIRPGSILAFLKLAGRMSSRPLVLPGRHLINSSLLAANVGCMGAFITLAPSSAVIGASLLAANTALSFAKGWTTSAAIGGADMPVLVTVLNAYSGLALVAEGFMLDNLLLTSVGSLIAASGSILSYVMVSARFLCIEGSARDVEGGLISQCRAMNRSLTNVIFGGIAQTAASDGEFRKMSDISL